MGWDYQHADRGEAKGILLENLNFEREHVKSECLKLAIVHMTEAYAAMRYTHKTGEKAGLVEVYAYVAAIRFVKGDYYNFGKKDMEESSGPYLYNCPKAILEMLTEPANDYAREWRKKCWDTIKEREERKKIKLGVGSKIELHGKPYEIIEAWGRGKFTVSSQNGGRYRFNSRMEWKPIIDSLSLA